MQLCLIGGDVDPMPNLVLACHALEDTVCCLLAGCPELPDRAALFDLIERHSQVSAAIHVHAIQLPHHLASAVLGIILVLQGCSRRLALVHAVIVS